MGAELDGDKALALMNGMLWTCMLVAGPVLLAAMVTGVLISVLQVATQLQEMTLSYVPKLVVCALTLAFLGPWLLGSITQYAIATIALIPQLG